MRVRDEGGTGTDRRTVSVLPFSKRRSHSPQWISAKPPWVKGSIDKVLICLVRSTTPDTGDSGESGRLLFPKMAVAPRLGMNNRGGGVGDFVTGNTGIENAYPACDAETEEPAVVGDEKRELPDISSDASEFWMTSGDDGGDRLKYVLVGESGASCSSAMAADDVVVDGARNK